ncbi:MAG TPA: hypothetical protein PLQ44_00085 [Candidatus Paceibacterota bacterium]|nr:hypothetical protein [Candidatus Paceibacterota bacterium]HPT40002.1 hypothetical protein [Candidatus Paceibacterota bacterium]
MKSFENKLKSENNSPETSQEKIAMIEQKLDVKYLEEEKEIFDQWLSQVPENSLQKPITITNIDDVALFLPEAPNYKEDKVNLFFAKEKFTQEELQEILEKFSKTNPSFEISLVRHNDDVISVGVGNKVRNSSTILSGEYFGHYHPTQIKLENSENLPHCFIMGLMPSAGDIKGFLRHAESVKGGTRIFSKNGYIFIKPTAETKDFSQAVESFSQSYFDLFLGLNKFDFKSDNEVIKYFKEKFGFDVDFHYFNQVKTENDSI